MTNPETRYSKSTRYRNYDSYGNSEQRPISGFYGDNRAAWFLKDAINGLDSVDIAVFGDSNAGSNDYGYTNAFDRVLSYQFGATMYATPLLSQGNYYQGVNSGNYPNYILAENMIGTGTWLNTAYVDPCTGGTTAGYTTAVGNNRLMGYFTGDANIDALKTHLGMVTTTINSNTACTVAQPNRWMALPCCVATGTTFAGTGLTNTIRLFAGSPLVASGSSSLEYRLVYGTFDSGTAGQFKLRVSDSSTTTYAISPAFIPTARALGYQTATLEFTGAGQRYCTWDGGNTPGGNVCSGPMAAMWGSIVNKSTKGYSVSNFTTSDGRTMVGLTTILSNMGKMLDSFVGELLNRQKSAGGSGRLVVYLNGGINGDTGEQWVTNASAMRDLLISKWAIAGGSPSNLAFVMTVSHPTTSFAPWNTGRAAVSTAANSWASTLGKQSGTCVVDIAARYPGTKLLSGTNPPVATTGYFEAGGQQHLAGLFSAAAAGGTAGAAVRGNGYDAVTGAIVGTLLMSAL
jgi:hypothetical protein